MCQTTEVLIFALRRAWCKIHLRNDMGWDSKVSVNSFLLCVFVNALNECCSNLQGDWKPEHDHHQFDHPTYCWEQQNVRSSKCQEDTGREEILRRKAVRPGVVKLDASIGTSNMVALWRQYFNPNWIGVQDVWDCFHWHDFPEGIYACIHCLRVAGGYHIHLRS